MRYAYEYSFGNAESKRPFGKPVMEGIIILELITKVWCNDVGCILLPQDWVKWQAVVNTVMNLQVPQMRGISSVAE
jgi:hypothetical protein